MKLQHRSNVGLPLIHGKGQIPEFPVLSFFFSVFLSGWYSRRNFRSLTTIWTVEKQCRAVMLGKSRTAVLFSMVRGSACSKSRLAKAAGAEVAFQQRAQK